MSSAKGLTDRAILAQGPQAGIQGLPESFTDEIEGEHDDENR